MRPCKGRWICESSRPAWSITLAPGQPGLYREALSQKKGGEEKEGEATQVIPTSGLSIFATDTVQLMAAWAGELQPTSVSTECLMHSTGFILVSKLILLMGEKTDYQPGLSVAQGHG